MRSAKVKTSKTAASRLLATAAPSRHRCGRRKGSSRRYGPRAPAPVVVATTSAAATAQPRGVRRASGRMTSSGVTPPWRNDPR